MAGIKPLSLVPYNSQLVPVAFAGENAQIANLETLAQAQQMWKEERARVTPDFRKIWKETGWFKNVVDGGWRFEIDDSGATFENGVFKHPELEAAYPKAFSEWTLVEEEMEDKYLQGYVRPYEKKIAVNASLSKEEQLETLVHEFQHVIQEIEGFGGGGNLYLATRLHSVLVSREYKNKLQEWKEQRGVIKDHTIQNWEEEFEKYKEIGRELDTIEEGLPEPTYSELYNLYQRMSGEAESRLVGSRIDLTEEERKQKYPLAGFDVPVYKQFDPKEIDTVLSILQEDPIF